MVMMSPGFMSRGFNGGLLFQEASATTATPSMVTPDMPVLQWGPPISGGIGGGRRGLSHEVAAGFNGGLLFQEASAGGHQGAEHNQPTASMGASYFRRHRLMLVTMRASKVSLLQWGPPISGGIGARPGRPL